MSDALNADELPSVESLVDPDEAQKSTMLMVAAPIIAMAGTFAAKKTLDFVYKQVTGHTPPKAADSRQPLARVLVWSLATAAAVAVVNVAVDRWLMPDPKPASE